MLKITLNGASKCTRSLCFYLLLSVFCLVLAEPQNSIARNLEAAYYARVIAVSDGDTIKVLKDSLQTQTIRLSGIDCPEKNQAFGAAAKNFTSISCFNSNVYVVPEDHDRYGRLVANVFLPDGRCLNQEIVACGFAWCYRKYLSANSPLYLLEAEARRKSLGLWADLSPVPPWQFRQLKKAGKRISN